jgi:hypothetical protein
VKKDRPGFLGGFPEVMNCPLSSVEARADLGESESVHAMMENLDLVALAEWSSSSHLELVNGS